MINWILPNHSSSFMKTTVLETSITDHHEMISSILLSLGDHTKLFAINISKTLTLKCSMFTWNLKFQNVQILLRSFCKSLKTLFNYLVFSKRKLFAITIKRLWPKTLVNLQWSVPSYEINITKAKLKKIVKAKKSKAKKRNKFLRNIKKGYLSNLNIKDITDDEVFINS